MNPAETAQPHHAPAMKIFLAVPHEARSMDSVYTVPLHAVDRTCIAACGGKAASLGELIRAGARVPPGFVILRGAFERFLADAPQGHRLNECLERLAHRQVAVEEAASAIRSWLRNAPMPAEVQAAIREAASQSGLERVSVRSSATCEDGQSSAWAGQLETYLDVAPRDLMMQVRRCWLSLFSPNALAYGVAHGFSLQGTAVAVVVQQMVDSDVSGIGFSVHPVTQEPDMQLIEAAYGLGTTIVSGEYCPEQFIVDKQAGRIVEHAAGRQDRALHFDRNQNRQAWREVNREATTSRLLSQHILECSRWLTRVEQHFGFPVDAEWALQGDEFYLLQARPITTLSEDYREPIVDDREPWTKLVRRSLSLLEVSIIGHWTDSQHSGRDLGLHADRFLVIQETPDLVTMFVGQSGMQAAMEHIRELDLQQPERLKQLLRRGQDVFEDALRRLERPLAEWEPQEIGEFFAETGRFTTAFPSWTLNALDEGSIDDPEVRLLAERLRVHSLYPRISRELLQPVAQKLARRIGFSTPEVVPHLATWNELLNGLVDAATLESRCQLWRSGYRFVWQLLDGAERLQFVPDSGYLLMRALGQRRQTQVDDPRCLSGQTAWPGVYRGRARVVIGGDAADLQMQHGEVLVSLQSNPDLMPLLERAGAIVTDDGGVACHAGILCRELKIPTVIGTGYATSAIRTGDLVEVDATAQVVRILERSPT